MKNIQCSVLSLNYGLMACWEEVKEAAVYHVHLLVGYKNTTKDNKGLILVKDNYCELALVDVHRNLKYYSFTDLAPIHLMKADFFGGGEMRQYYIFVEAEDRMGKIVASSELISGVVEVL